MVAMLPLRGKPGFVQNVMAMLMRMATALRQVAIGRHPFAQNVIGGRAMDPVNAWERKPTRTINDLTADERAIIRARHNGWESASPGLLALVFSVPVQAINAVLKGTDND